MKLDCAQFEEFLSDYLDGTLGDEARAGVEDHASGCAACAALASDAAEAVAFIGRAAIVEPPMELVQKIMAEARTAAPQSLVERFVRKWLAPVLEPRVAMGVAMSVLSIAIIGRNLKPFDFQPGRALAATENRIYRVWDRTVRNAENTPIVAQLEDQLAQLNEDSRENAPGAPGR